MDKLRIRPALATLAAAALVGGCTSPPPPTTPDSAGFADCATNPLECNTGPTQPGGTITYLYDQDIATWNLTNADGNHYPTAQMLAGIVPSTGYGGPDVQAYPNLDLLAEPPRMTDDDPQTMVYTIRPEAVWSDGTPISADDFIYIWKTHNLRDCPQCEIFSETGYDIMESVVGSDDGKTVTVTLEEGRTYADWLANFGALYPAHIAAESAGVDSFEELDTPEEFLASYVAFTETQPTWSGGPYMIESYEEGQQLVVVPNQSWYGNVKPSLDKIVYKIVTDQSSVVPALRNGELDAGDPQPNLDIVTQLQDLPGFYVNLQAGASWEHIDFNLDSPLLKDPALREAIFRAVDVQAIIDRTVGTYYPDAKPLYNHNFLPGTTHYTDVVTSTGAGAGDIDAAKEVLTDAGYQGVGTELTTPDGDPVTLRFVHTENNVNRQTTAELVQHDLAELGIGVEIIPTASLGRSLVSGDYDIIVFAWVGSPFVIGGADQIWGKGSGSNYGNWVNDEADALIKEAQSVALGDLAAASELLNQANEIMAEDYYVLPLFQRASLQICRDTIANLRPNTTSSGPGYNVQEWGLRSTAA
jgi:peptide/nickel transport system substrate-binding protein